MSFGAGDRKEVEGLMSKLTTMVDAIGRSRRDVKLTIRINPHWPSSILTQLNGYVTLFDELLRALDSLEDQLGVLLQQAHPLD